MGIALAQYLAGLDIPVAAIVNPRSPRINDIPGAAHITIIECDLAELPDLSNKLQPVYDAFFHLGWEATESRAARNDPMMHAKNIQYTLDAVKTAQILGCKTFVGAGSQSELHCDGFSTENGSAASTEESYGIAKYAAGRLSLKLCEQHGMRHGWARILSIYGPGERETTALMYCIHTLIKGEKPSFTKGEQLWDYLYSADCARALYLIATKGRHGRAYNLGSGCARPLREYFELTSDNIDPSLPLGIGEKEYPPGQPMRLCADIQTLREDTGFTPEYSFQAGIRKTVEWVRSKKFRV